MRHIQAAPPIQPLAAPCNTPVVTLTAVHDTWIDENAPNLNHGSDGGLHTKPDAGDLSRTLIQFDLSSIPANSLINCATLHVYERDKSDDQTIYVHRITNSWNAPEATWLNRETGITWTSPGGDYDPTVVASFPADTNNGYQDIDVTSLVQFWVDNPGSNFGTLLRSTTTGSIIVIEFSSIESAKPPQLIVDYGKRPNLSINKTGSSSFVAPGSTITYTIVVSNSGTADAIGIIISDSLPANTNFVNNSITLDPPDAGTKSSTPPRLAGNLTISSGQQVTVTFAATVNTLVAPGTVITNKAELISAEILTPTATFTSVVTGLFNPVLFVDKDGPTTAMVGDVVTFTYRLLNLGLGDGSLINNFTVTDSIAGAAIFTDGDFNGTNHLEVSEVWSYMATYTIKATDPNPLVNVVIVQGRDQENEIVQASDTFTTTLALPSVYIPIILKPG